ncbi:MAG: hypothetical protein IPJ37_08710 [Bacteroidales bacterium]|nr:hypothetical protein [Bacteroidales bacterium]
MKCTTCLTLFLQQQDDGDILSQDILRGHHWPDSDLIADAVEWLVLQAMNRKVIPADQTFISYLRIKLKTSSLHN